MKNLIIPIFVFQIIFLKVLYAEKLRLTLEWLLNPHHAPLVIGISEGFFKEEGLDIQLIQAQGSLEGCIQVSVGASDLAITNEAQWIIQADKGLKLDPVLMLIAQPLEVFISRLSIQELKGKKIGHSSSGMGFSACVLKNILNNQKLTLDDIIPIHTKYSLVSALLTGQVDAIINAYRTYAVVDLKQHLQEFKIYPYEDLGIPLFAAQIIVANPKVTLETKQALKRALIKACSCLQRNPDHAWDVFRKFRTELDIPANKSVWEQVVPLFKVEPLLLNSTRHKNLKDFLKKNQLIRN